ncbi:GNAT family N-acetyltransferase [Sphingomonas immobilis]|uniref:N-acetyltransferase family protein n=1 Tax=Sphingomonas immobilis TaxID=3063997 RepID=A0ABT9A3X6_9SPHN|nr:GNAT family N-acetyltransferase [Sphingomonas sp. CA1-15]MDO7844546.1 N-acetyltransferase family protein [Sphingomonas sp. CA1-15]
MSAITCRPATPADAEAIAIIYAHHVLHGTATFDTAPRGVDVWADKIAEVTAQGWPFLAAEREGAVAGYAYATQFRDRAAYARSCEDSIYIAAGLRRSGIGTILLTALVVAAREAGFREIVAVIGGPEPASVALHAKLGFREAGRLSNIGEKFGRLLDTLYMQRSL